MALPSPLNAVVLILPLACSPAWGKPPVKPQRGNIAAPSCAEQQDCETISGFLPRASGMEANLASTLCSDLWTHSTRESCFPPTPQPCAAPRPSDFLHSPPLGSAKMPVFDQGQAPCQQNRSDQMEIMKGCLAVQLNLPLPQHKCQYCARTCKTRAGLTWHENKCRSKPDATLQNEPLPAPSVPPSSPAGASLNEEPVAGEEPSLTLAECSRLVSAYIEHPEWQDFLDSGRHATTQTTAANTGWAGLKLDTVSPADKETPFPALTPIALEALMQVSPSISRLYRQLQTGKDPLADRDDLKTFINKASNKGELFTGGNHSLVIKWHKGPGYVFKIARSGQDHIRLHRERDLYIWLRDSDNILLNLTTTPMRTAFSVHGKPVLALRQVDGTARDRLLLMRKHHSLNERLDFALSVTLHFCQMYRRFLEKDVLLADRHDDNIGFNEIPLQGRKSMGLDDAIIQVPVMLDLDPYWFGGQEFRELQLRLPTWVPVVTGLLEEVFTPVDSDSQISESRVKIIDKIRQLASPVFCSSPSSSIHPETDEGDIQTILQSCINHWFYSINPGYSKLLAEARAHIQPLLSRLNQWDSTPRTVAGWNKRLLDEMEQVLQWLHNWKNRTEFSLLKDFTDQGIIRVPSIQRDTIPQDQQILTLFSVIHGKLRCQKCSRTFTTNTEFRRHWQHHQQKKLQRCKLCGGDFIEITGHERIHTGEKPYRCRHCGRCFTQNCNLIIHLRIHSGYKPYKCELCGKTFSRSNVLQGHLRAHSGDKPYKCEHCGRCFAQSSNLKSHLRIHSGDKPYKCKDCGKCFAWANVLKNHLRIHSGDKPYKCEECGKCFAYNNVLKDHLRIHSGDKPYRCEHCGKTFSKSSGLRSHLRTHSGNKP